MVELSDGSLLAILRTSLGYLYQSVSTDRGETWSDPVTTGLESPSVATCLKRIPDTGDLLLIWNNTLPYGMSRPDSTATHKPRNPLTSAVSRDDGKTWEFIQDIERRVGYDQGYPSVSFIDGEAFVTYYATMRTGRGGSDAEVMLKIFPIEWFYGKGGPDG